MTLQLINKKILDEKTYTDMQNQFPPEELKSREEYNRLLTDGDYKFGLVFDDEKQIGYILYLAGNFVWVDYVAVLKDFHSQGYGSRILTALFEKYSQLEGCYFEVEPENETLPHTIRRMNFYKKLGCKELDFSYYFPNPVKKLRMKLLYKSFSGELPDIEKIKKDVEFVFNILHNRVECKDKILDLIYRENS